MKATVVPTLVLILATSAAVVGQAPNTMPGGATAECPDGSGWDATTWPVKVTEDGRHFIRVLELYADASGESHGREGLLLTEVAPAPGGDGPPYHKVPNVPFSLGYLGDVPAGFDNSLHTTPSPRLISFPYGEVCLTTSDGMSWRMWPNRLVLAQDTVGKGHATKTLNNKPAVFFHSLLAPGTLVPMVYPSN